MAGARSIIDIDVNDEAFKRFMGLFAKYQDALKATPGAWGKAAAEAQAVTAAVLAQTRLTKEEADGQRAISEETRKRVQAEREITNYRRSQVKAGRESHEAMKKTVSQSWMLARNVASVVASLAKWGAAGAVAAVGGTFLGLDHLAHGAAGSRRAAQGLGVSTAEREAFGINYGRFVDPDSFLGNVNDVSHDLTKRYALYGVGLSDADINGKSTAEIAEALLPRLRERFIQGGKTQQGMQAFGLDQFGSLQDFIRLSQASPEELRARSQSYRRDRAALAVPDDVQRKWLELSTQLSRAGQSIENTLIRGLAPLAPKLEVLSDAFTKAIEDLLKHPELGAWIDGFAKGIGELASYIGSPQFKSDMKEFGDNISALAKGTVAALRWLGLIPDPNKAEAEERRKREEADGNERPFDWWNPGTYLYHQGGPFDRKRNPPLTEGALSGTVGSRGNNIWNLRVPGSKDFQVFPNEEAGTKAAARQLGLYFNRDKIDTIRGIISKWAPKEDGNDTEGYIRYVSQRTGYGDRDRINLNDPAVLSQILAAMATKENSRNISPKEIEVTISNNTGGSAVVTTRQVAQ